MGCKCANKSDEEQEIDKKGLEDGNLEKAENDFNSNFKKSNLDLLGLDDQINRNDNEIIENNNYDDNNDEFLLNEKSVIIRKLEIIKLIIEAFNPEAE